MNAVENAGAFLFLPTAAGARTARRVDIANIASLFAEVEEPARRSQSSVFARLLALILILLLAVGDFVLVARPDAPALSPRGAAPATRAVTTI